MTSPASERRPMTAPSFVARLMAAMERIDLLEPTKHLIIAVGAHETGWGSGVAYRFGFNAWNLTAGSKWTGDVVPGPDKEPDGKGGWRRKTQRWRVYGSDREGVLGYLTFLRLNYPRAHAAILQADVVAFVAGLRDDPATPQHERDYFTADPVAYLADVRGCLGTVRRLLGLPVIA